MKITKTIPLIIILLSFLLDLYFYFRLPNVLATHWDINGQVDGYASKSFALFFMPILSVGLYLLFLILPATDPYRQNFKQFEKHFNNFIAIVFGFLFYLYFVTILWHLGVRFNMIQALSPAFAVIFYYTGVLTSHAKRNWFVGIRTPWTISSQSVWDKTHRLGGRLFKIVALISLGSFLFPQYGFFLILVPVLSTTILLFAYSFIVFSGEAKT